jgi:Insertion element 4 transposase N-terminal/Transposase DDE domain
MVPCKESTLKANEAGRVLDKLILLEKVIGAEDVRQVLFDTGCLDKQRCRLTREVTFWIILAMGVFTELSMRQIFKQCRRLNLGLWTPQRSTLCKARQRVGLAPVRLLYERLARPLASPDTPGAYYRGWRTMAIDGTVYNVPDSDANAAAFGYPKGGRGNGAFPQVRKLSLVETGTHAEVAFVVKGLKEKESGEISMVPGLFRHLRSDMLLMWDRGFCSYNLWKQLLLRSCQVLARVKVHLVLKPVQTLADGSYLARIYHDAAHRARDEGGILLRVIRYTLDDPQRVGCGKEHVLVTTLQDEKTYPATELICEYHERWEIESVFDEQKTHQNPWRVTKSSDLRSETPLGVLQELYALSIGHYVTRAFMAEAASMEGLDPDRLSFLGCLQVLRCRLSEYPSGRDQQEQWYELVLKELVLERTEERRLRINPRVVKVKMSKFKKKQRAHRGLLPLERPFQATVVMQVAS